MNVLSDVPKSILLEHFLLANKITVIIDGDERGLKKASAEGVRDLSRLEKAAERIRNPQVKAQDFAGINTLSRGQLAQVQQFAKERQRIEQQNGRIALAEKKSELRQFEQIEKHKNQIAQIGAKNQAQLAEETARQVTQEKQSELRRFEQVERQKERLVEISARQRIQAEKLAAQHAENAKKREFQDFQRIERQKSAFQLAEARRRNSGTSLVGGVLDRGSAVVGIAATAGVVLAAREVIQIGVEYEKALNTLQAVTKASAEEMKAAANEAKKLGADLTLPATSAGDAALAMTELAKAGFTVQQSMGAAKGVLQLAAAAQIDEARAAEIAANALNSFRLQAAESVKVADLLAAASNASSAEITDIAESMQQASAVFAGAKIPIQDLVTAIGLMANQGVKASDAGTSLKTFLTSLTAPTDKASEVMKRLGVDVFDAAGKMKDLPNIIGQFEKALVGLTDEEKQGALKTIFGQDAIRAAQILFSTGTEGFEKMQQQVTQMGAAADLAAAKTKGLGGAWDALKSQLETIAIDIFERVGPEAEKVIRGITNELAKPENERNWREAGAVLGRSLGESAKKAFDQTFVQGETPGFLQYIEGAGAQILPSFGYEASLKGLLTAFKDLTIAANVEAIKFYTGIAEKIAGGQNELRAAMITFLAPLGVVQRQMFENGGIWATFLITGFVSGIYNGAVRVAGAIRDLINRNVTSEAYGALKAQSPSKVFQALGEFTIDGLIAGMENRAKNAAGSARRIAIEVTKAFREALKEFEKLAGASPQSIQTIEQTDRVREAAQAQREIIKLRKELGVNQGQPLPTTVFGTEDEIASLRRQKKAVEDLDKSYEKLREDFKGLQEAQAQYSDDVEKALEARRVTGELALLDLAEEIDLMGVLDENQRRQITNLYEIERLRIELSDGKWGEAMVTEALEIAKANQQARAELERVLAIRKQVAGAESLGRGLSDELESLQRGGRELTEYERVLRQINTDYKDISDSQKEYLLNMARQVDAQRQFNEQYAETFNFVRDTLDTLTDSTQSFGDRIKNVFKSIADRFKQMVLDMAATWLTNKIFGVNSGGQGGGFNLGGLFGSGGGFGGTPNFNQSVQGSGQGNIFSALLGSLFGGGNRSGGTFNQELAHLGRLSGGSHELGHIGQARSSIGGGFALAQGIGLGLNLFGGLIGGRFGNILSAAGTGASIGTVLLPGIGTAIGAGLGALIGLFSNPQRKKDEQLRSQYRDEAVSALLSLISAAKQGDAQALPQGTQVINQYRAAAQALRDKKTRKIALNELNPPNIIWRTYEDLKKADVIGKQKRAADLRPILPEFATGGYMDSRFTAQHRNYQQQYGILRGGIPGKDSIQVLAQEGELFANKAQQRRINEIAGFDVLSHVGFNNYPKAKEPIKMQSGGFIGTAQAAPTAIGDTHIHIYVESETVEAKVRETVIDEMRGKQGVNVTIENVQKGVKNKRL